MLDDFSIRRNFPYLHGVYLAINAIPDAFLLVDAPDCVFFTAEHIYGNHDLNSTLLDCRGYHRILHTSANVRNIAVDHSGDLAAQIRELENSGLPKAIFLTSKPMAAITGIQYDLVVRNMNPQPNVPVVEIPSKGLIGDWLDGYAETLKAIAEKIDFRGGQPKQENVAIIGYMMDRIEDDHTANVRELIRIIEEGLSLNLVSVWLSNAPFSTLSNVKDAGTIISFPHAREAARIVAGRTGAKLIETGLPFGIDATRKWIMRIAELLGKTREAEAFVDVELGHIAPKLKWVVPRTFLQKNIAYCGDPHFIDGLRGMCEELGCRISFAACFSREEHLKEYNNELIINGNAPLVEPKETVFLSKMRGVNYRDISLFVTNSIFMNNIEKLFGPEMRIMEFGFPSYSYHALCDSPFLGFRGAMNFINRMANSMKRD